MRSLLFSIAVVAALSACGQSDEPIAASQSKHLDAMAAARPLSEPNPSAASDVMDQSTSFDVWAQLTPEVFRKHYDALAKADGGDTIKQMNRAKDGVAVTLHDEQFQRAIAEMKKLDLVKGRFQSKIAIRLTTDNIGRVTKIAVVGDRSDPVNLMRFIGAVGVVDSMLNPAQDEKANTDFLATLGLMRGDDDPSIGQPVSSINQGGVFHCVSMRSDQTTGVGCVVEPQS